MLSSKFNRFDREFGRGLKQRAKGRDNFVGREKSNERAILVYSNREQVKAQQTDTGVEEEAFPRGLDFSSGSWIIHGRVDEPLGPRLATTPHVIVHLSVSRCTCRTYTRIAAPVWHYSYTLVHLFRHSWCSLSFSSFCSRYQVVWVCHHYFVSSSWNTG